jgi:hypothetical protein
MTYTIFYAVTSFEKICKILFRNHADVTLNRFESDFNLVDSCCFQLHISSFIEIRSLAETWAIHVRLVYEVGLEQSFAASPVFLCTVTIFE